MDAESFRKICEYKQEINKLLEQRPELRPLQAKIDEMLAGAGNQHNRCVLITQMMKDRLADLLPQLSALSQGLHSLAAEVINEADQKSD